MKHLYLYLFFTFFTFSAVTQNKVDSLKQLVEISEEKEQAYIYYQLSKELFYKDVLKVRYYSLKADSLSNIYGIDSTRVNALNNLTYVSLQTGKVKKAFMYSQAAIELAERKNLKKEMMKSIFFKGYYLYATGQTDSSLLYLDKAYKLASKAKESKIKMKCLNTMAANYLSQAKYDKALTNFTRAYEIADSLQLKKMLPNLSLNIGTTLLYNEDIEHAISYFEKVIEMSDSTDVTIAYVSALNNLGSCYSKIADHKKALIYFEKALPPYQKINNKFQIAQLYANLGQSNYNLGRIEVAKPYIDKAITLNRASKSTNQLIVNLIILGNLQLKKKEYLQAKFSFFEAKDLVEKNNINYNKVDLYKGISDYFESTKQYKQALEYKQKELNFRDSTFTETRQQQISELQTKFETKLKENENESLRKDLALNELNSEKQTQIRNFFIILAVFVIILILILLNRARLKKISLQIIEKQKTELEIANNTKDKFFAIIAHDLKSPFSALVGLCQLLSEAYNEISDDDRKMYIDDILEASNNTFGLLENLLTWSRIQQGQIKIKKMEMDISDLIGNSILLHKTAAKLKNITIVNNAETRTKVLIDKPSIETVIVNLVNNALKFTHEGGIVHITSEEQNDKLVISISDNGVGMTQQQIDQLFRIDESISTPGTNKETGTGLGLILCKEFIELNDGKIWVESEMGKGSTFKFSLDRK